MGLWLIFFSVSSEQPSGTKTALLMGNIADYEVTGWPRAFKLYIFTVPNSIGCFVVFAT